MKSFNLFKSLFVIGAIVLFGSCSEDDTLIDQHDDNNLPTEEVFHMAGGVVFLDENEYNSFPMIDVTEAANIYGEGHVESRASKVILKMPPVISQGQEGSCTAFATTYCVDSYYINAIGGLPYTNDKAIRSPEYVYNSTKVKGDCASGAYTNVVLNFIRDKGASSWSQMPYSDINGCAKLPNATQLSQGALGKIKSWNTVAKNVASVKTLINKGYPVVMAFEANINFLSQTSKAPFIYTSYKKDSKPSGHAVAIIGYDDNKQCLIVQNSWGTWNHDKGFFYVSYNLFPSIAQELYVMNPIIPQNIKIRHASSINGTILFNFNNVQYTIKKGQTLSLPAKLDDNTFYVWECIWNKTKKDYDCKWDGDYKPIHSTNYKITDLTSNWDLKLVKE